MLFSIRGHRCVVLKLLCFLRNINVSGPKAFHGHAAAFTHVFLFGSRCVVLKTLIFLRNINGFGASIGATAGILKTLFSLRNIKGFALFPKRSRWKIGAGKSRSNFLKDFTGPQKF